MKFIRFIRLLGSAAWLPLASLAYADPPQPPSPPGGAGAGGIGLAQLRGEAPQPPRSPTGGGSSSTSVSTSVTDGKGTITIITEKDGKKEVRTFNLNSDDPTKLAEQLADEIKAHGEATLAPAKKKVTYLGVMLAEPSSPYGGGGGFGYAGVGAGGGSTGAAASPPAGLPPGTGLNITGVSSGSPAEKAGLQGGDVLAKLDEQILVNPSQFTTLIRNKKEGDTIKLAFVRNGESKDLEITLATHEEDQPGGFGFGSSGQGGGGKFLRPEKFPGGSADGLQEGRVLRLDKEGRILEEWLGAGAPPRFAAPPPPGALPGVPAPPAPAPPEKLKTLYDLAQPQWEKALRDAAEVKDKAAEQWKKQLSDWRAQWVETQEKTAADYRKAMEKMSGEIRKANEAAQKAQEEARRAIEAWKEKRTDEKTPPPPAQPPADEKKDPDQPKKA